MEQSPRTGEPVDPNSTAAIIAHPPGAWLAGRRVAQELKAPIERFLHDSASSGILLLAVAVGTLVLANSPLAHLYEAFLHYELGFEWGEASFREDVHFWINEGLMTVFFLVVGLEVKREMAHGTLSSLRAASLPCAAALGGMVVPAIVYLGFNVSGGQVHGWAVPTATDIAFAVGVLSLLGDRVPAPLRVFLLALAVVDDIGAVLVIALFYSGGISAAGVPYLVAGLAMLYAYGRLGVRPSFLSHVIPTVLLWMGLHACSLHPTLAGVVVGLAVPATPWYGARGFLSVARRATDRFAMLVAQGAREEDCLVPLKEIGQAQRETVSPVVRLTDQLHLPSSFVIVPLFAFANAGVAFGELELSRDGAWLVLLGTALGLALGKPLGVGLAVWVAVRLNFTRLPPGTTPAGILVVGLLAGIGFTMSIFIAQLAFGDGHGTLAVAKLGILVGTALAAGLGLGLGRALLRPPTTPDPVLQSVELAERTLV
ncbi:MAG: Na+/H+ antiporter NhaA [Sandaracinaceae bacterium]